MLTTAVFAVVILMLPIGYVIFRKLSVTRYEIAFPTPQDGVSAVYLDIREDTIRGLHILYEDGSVAEVPVDGRPGVISGTRAGFADAP